MTFPLFRVTTYRWQVPLHRISCAAVNHVSLAGTLHRVCRAAGLWEVVSYWAHFGSHAVACSCASAFPEHFKLMCRNQLVESCHLSLLIAGRYLFIVFVVPQFLGKSCLTGFILVPIRLPVHVLLLFLSISN